MLQVQVLLGWHNKLHLLLHQISLIHFYRELGQFAIVGMLTNDRALAIGH